MTKVYPMSEKEAEVSIETSVASEKQERTPCDHHASAPTPRLDAYVSQSDVQARMRAISKDLAEAADGNQCWKCAMSNALQTLTAEAHNLRAEKKSGRWSAEEKKAFKSEAKGYFKETKRDLKTAWKAEKATRR